jgi:hypothetical protein
MRKVIQEASQELVAKLVRAGYLQHALRHDADATTMAIARLKEICEAAGTMKAPQTGRRTPCDPPGPVAASCCHQGGYPSMRSYGIDTGHCSSTSDRCRMVNRIRGGW